MAEHTPGPWIVDGGGSDALGVFPKDANDPNPICYLSENAYAGLSLRGRETDEANAALIAAAPELLNALKRMVFIADSKGETGAIIGSAKDAIARAEGREEDEKPRGTD